MVMCMNGNVMFSDMKKYVSSERLFNTLCIEIRQKKRQKRCPLFLSCVPTHHSFTFNLQFLYELKYKVQLSKIVSGIFHFRFRFVFIKVYIFVQQNAWTL